MTPRTFQCNTRGHWGHTIVGSGWGVSNYGNHEEILEKEYAMSATSGQAECVGMQGAKTASEQDPGLGLRGT